MINSQTYKDDLQIAFHSIVGASELAGCKVLITGGTGLVGEPIVDLLLNAGATVYVAARNAEKVYSKFGSSVKTVEYDANSAIKFDENFDYIIHAASNAHPAAMMSQPVETFMANVYGIGNLLEYAKKHNTRRVLYVSSSEVYGKKESGNPFMENMYGYVDILNPRSSYPIGKRAAETLCISYQAEYGVDTVIVRLGHIYGPTASKNDNRVSSVFAYQAAKGNDIVMKSDGSQLRSYMYCLDCASAIITVLLNGKIGEAYNIASSGSVASIRQMAELYANAGNVKLKLELPSEEEKVAFNPMRNSSLNSEKLESLGWMGKFTADIGFTHTIQAIKEANSLCKEKILDDTTFC